jgi:hypothetical protein
VTGHGSIVHQHLSPPPSARLLLSRWEQVPPANRQRLLCLLSRLVERQLAQPPKLHVEDGHDGVERDT